MARPSSERLVRNDLKVVSLVVILSLIMVLGLELRPEAYDIGSAQSPDDDGDGPPQPPTPVEIEVLSTTGHTSEQSTSEEAFALRYAQVLSIEVILSWVDDYGDNDEFGLRLLWEGSEEGSAQGSSGTLVIEVSDDEGPYVGNFTVEIAALDCPGQIGPLPRDRDDGNDWDLVVRATVIEEAGEG